MFSKPNEFYAKTISNNHLIDDYKKNLFTFINKLNSPNKQEQIDKINNQIPKKIIANYIDYPSPGNMEVKQSDLLNLTNNIIDRRLITTPSGSCYIKAKEKKSIASDYINERKALRSQTKKEMKTFKAKGDKHNTKLKYFEQLTIKKMINSASGVSNKTNYLLSIPNYNAITSSARSNTMNGYAIIEQSLGANLYFKDIDDAINFIVNHLNVYPGDDIIKNIIDKYNIKIPTFKDFEYYIKRGVVNYILYYKSTNILDQLLNKLSPLEQTFIFYCQCINNLFIYNSELFVPYFRTLFNFKEIDSLRIDNIKEKSIYDVDDFDLLMCIITFSYKLTKGKTLDDINDIDFNLKSIILNRYNYMYNYLSQLEDLFNVFILVPINTADLFNHVNMLRNITILSDTDSNIFTTIAFVYWYTHDIAEIQDAVNIYNIIVYFTVKILEHVLALSVKSTNADTSTIKKIKMKNEFYYPTFIRTTMSKHYLASLKIQEGVVLPSNELDIKGKNFKASDLSADIVKEISNLSKDIMDEIEQSQYLDSDKIIRKVINYEYKIYNDLKEGNTTYLSSLPIKDKSEYKDYIVSQYFNYMLWQATFSKQYGEIEIPSKVRVFKLKKKISVKSTTFFETLKEKDEIVYNNLTNFLSGYPNKKIDIIILPSYIKIPNILIDLMNYREIIARNLFGLYLLLRSLGISYFNINEKKLLGEIYSNYNYD